MLKDFPPIIEAWVTFLNTQDSTGIKSVLGPDVLIIAYQEGPDGPSTKIEGLEGVIDWVQYPPKGRFVFALISLEASTPCPELPSGDLTLKGTYQVSHTESDFTNQGSWTFSIQDGLIKALLHIPRGI